MALRHVVMPQLQATAAANPLFEVVREYFRRPDVVAAMQTAYVEWRVQHGIAEHVVPIDLRELHTPKHPRWPGINGLWAELAGKFDGTEHVAQYSAHRLVRSGPAGLVEAIIARGVDPNARGDDGRTLLAEAIRSGNAPAATVLRSFCADDTAVSAVDRWIGACVRVDLAEAARIVTAHHDLLRRLTQEDYDVVIRAACANRLDLLDAMLTSGADPDGIGSSGATALHHAAWHGHVDAVRSLLARGARRDVRDLAYHGLPLDWAIHGAIHCRDADDEYRVVREALDEG